MKRDIGSTSGDNSMNWRRTPPALRVRVLFLACLGVDWGAMRDYTGYVSATTAAESLKAGTRQNWQGGLRYVVYNNTLGCKIDIFS